MENDAPSVDPPNLIPDELSPEISQWLSEQQLKVREHDRLVAARAAIRLSQDPRNIRAS